MQSSYIKRYANHQLNSMLKETVDITGTLEKRIPFKERESEKEVYDLIPLNNSQVLLTTSNSIIVINLQDGKVDSERRIFRQSPVIVNNSNTIHFCDGFLFRQTAETIMDKKTRWIIPGYPGTYSSLKLLVPFDELFISGVIQEPTPKDPNRYQYVLAARNYQNGSKAIWKQTYSSNLITPPLTSENNLIICGEKFIEKISVDGKKIDAKEIEGIPLCCSVSEGDNIYLIRKLNGQNFLTMLSNELAIQWECSIPLPTINQPPVILADDVAVLLGSGRISAYSAGKQLWVQPQTGDLKNPFKAVATGNKKILLIDSSKLLCLDDSGKIEWTFTKEEDGPFMTQLVIDESGRVLVADNKALYILK